MKEKIAGLSIIANFILAVSKILAGILASSASVLADGVHSTMDIFSSAISLVGIKVSKKPVDEKHPYGHYKFEVLSGLVITIILFITGAGIIYKSYKGFLSPSELKLSYLALGAMLFSAIVNEVMAKFKIYYGKKENSISLISDGVHSRVDVLASIVIFIGIILDRFWIYIDPLLALLIGLYIIKESFSLGKEATSSLLDVSAGEEIESKIKRIAEEQSIKISQLKTQKKGSVITANIEIELPKNLSVKEATAISNKLKKKLMEKIETLEYVAVQIKDHDLINSSFKPRESISKIGFGNGFGWQGKGRFRELFKEAEGKGPEGYCVCPKCGYKEPHKRGIPCPSIKCPKCGTSLVRE